MEDLIKSALNARAKQLILRAGHPPILQTEAGFQPLPGEPYTNEAITELARSFDPKSIDALQSQSAVRGVCQIGAFGDIPFALAKQDGNLILAFDLRSVNTASYTEATVATNVPSFAPAESTPDSHPLLGLVEEHKEAFAILALKTPDCLKMATEYLQKAQLFPISLSDAKEIGKIFESYQPKAVFFEEDFPNFSYVFKYLYDLETKQRLSSFHVLINRRDRSGDTRTALAKSVDLVVNMGDLMQLASLVEKAWKKRDDFFAHYKEALKN